MKSIILCADDYGLNAAVSQGIVNLISQKRLSATSCLTTFPMWSKYAQELQPFHGKVDIGLHLNLTEGEGFESQGLVIVKAMLRQLEVEVIAAEFEAQLLRFKEGLGFWPDFVDGHQHVHVLPVVREALLRVYQKHLTATKPYVRSLHKMLPAPDLKSQIKRGIIFLCGARGLYRLLEAQGIPHNESFAGIYSFDQAAAYAKYFPDFLKHASPKHLIMCHPGLNTSTPPDVIADARFAEYSYFSSDGFLEACSQAGVTLA